VHIPDWVWGLTEVALAGVQLALEPHTRAAPLAAPLAEHNLSSHFTYLLSTSQLSASPLSALNLVANSLAAHNLSPRSSPHLTCLLSNWPQLSRSLYASPLAAPLAAQASPLRARC
jgi:hypothetical protein